MSYLSDNQVRTFQLQVFRSGVWVDIPVTAAHGNKQQGQAGTLEVKIADRLDDQYRSILYEGDKVRAICGIMGSQSVRRFTGFVDAPTGTDQAGINRDVTCTDYMKELTDAILLEGIVFDTWTPMSASAWLIQKAIDTGQFKPTDDNGTPLLSCAGYNLGTNPLVNFPDIFNFDSSLFTLASGTLGSFTTGNFGFASFGVPAASMGQTYTAFELPNQYIIASTVQIYGWTIASYSQTLPPASGTTIFDFVNGIMYFNPLDGGRAVSFSAIYYSQPNWAFQAGTQVVSVINQIQDMSGCRWNVNGSGQFWSKYIDTTRAPKRIYNRGQYVQNQIQTNRDRRNVIVVEGWDGNCGQIIASKVVNYDDANNPPPKGLGKRSYMITQNKNLTTQAAVNNGAYYAIQMVGRRGRIAGYTIVDDPNLNLEDAVGFIGSLPEIDPGMLFYITGIDWQYTLSTGKINVEANITASSLPGRGTIYLGPPTGVTQFGEYDFTQDSYPMATTSASLSPAGGTLQSTFSIAGGLQLCYSATTSGMEGIDIYGSDNSHLGTYSASRSAGYLVVILPASSMNPGIYYAIKLRFEDYNGNIAVYRDLICAQP